jgi:hypothetical protein
VLPPTAATVSSPPDNGTGVSINGNLTWAGGSSQCEGLTATYDVYFGTSSPPPLDHNNGSVKSFDPGLLEFSTTYYWRIVKTRTVRRRPVWSHDPDQVRPDGVHAQPFNNKTNGTNRTRGAGDSQCGLAVTTGYFGPTEALGEEYNRALWKSSGNLTEKQTVLKIGKGCKRFHSSPVGTSPCGTDRAYAARVLKTRAR